MAETRSKCPPGHGEPCQWEMLTKAVQRAEAVIAKQRERIAELECENKIIRENNSELRSRLESK